MSEKPARLNIATLSRAALSGANSGDDSIEFILFCILVGGLAWAPFWLGSNRVLPWGVNGVLFPLLTLVYEVSLLVRGRRHPFALKRIGAPAAVFLLVLAWICVQMSTEAAGLFPSLTHPIWGMAAETLRMPVAASISVNRGATAIALLRLLTLASLFWLVLQLCRSAPRANLLLQAISLIVAVYSAAGLALAACCSGAIPLFEAPANNGLVRSTFVNTNNFATYAGLGLLVSVALILRLYRHEVHAEADSFSHRLAAFIETTGRRGWFPLCCCLLILVALLGSVSRGGICAAMLGLLGVYSLSLSRGGRGGGIGIEAVAFVTIALGAGFAFYGDLFFGRMAYAGVADSGRLAVFRITLNSIFDAPLLGFGYGTFADVFPMYRDRSISALELWDKAHNSYLEMFQGLGFVFGLALLGVVGALVAKCFAGAVTRRRDATAAIVAAAASLLVGFHAAVDFSLQIEAVALTYTALLAAGVAQSESSLHDSAD
ncbi:O-antigen ligase family protein [Methylocystis heyeri]|uniref:O-antigen ligase family protein n=1 Tax=Methylocystis heyeri TaxID=391905 RepID=A0A6B8KCE4_9HYPH|nr:O-antigen ligase family protein [Methylocystis heyeri]QGM45252.1 O-antigen ligase family protein [Methylocystis heyeri]